MSQPRLLLCRPQGGLNDTLCQIEKACRYAERFDRTVVVETDSYRTVTFGDRFSNYFISRQSRLVLDAAELRARFDELDVLPAQIRGRVTTYTPVYSASANNLADETTGQTLSFDFRRDHAQPLLVHHAWGGGDISLKALGRMRLHPDLGDLLARRLASIGPRFVGVHIRHTDYRTSYRAQLPSLARKLKGPIFIATDNRAVLADCRDVFGAERVHSFARLPEEAGQPAHALTPDRVDYESNADAILDLLMLAHARRIVRFKLDANKIRSIYSGYSRLAINLKRSPRILNGLLGRIDLPRTWRFA
jgi:hypothetical protein